MVRLSHQAVADLGQSDELLVSRISVPSLTLCHFVHLTNKRLVTCNLLFISKWKTLFPNTLTIETKQSPAQRHMKQEL